MILVSGSEPFVGTAVGMLLLMLPPIKRGETFAQLLQKDQS